MGLHGLLHGKHYLTITSVMYILARFNWTISLLRALQSMTNLGLFYDCSPLVPIWWFSSPISNAHCLQIFFNWIQHLRVGPSTRPVPSASAPLLYRNSIFHVLTLKSLTFLRHCRCFRPVSIVTSFSTVAQLVKQSVHFKFNKRDHKAELAGYEST
jgi:hypothetical protein